LRQLQLIQILRINAPGAVPAAQKRAKACGVNDVGEAVKRGEGGVRGPDAAFRA
jgi:hypothetical protein